MLLASQTLRGIEPDVAKAIWNIVRRVPEERLPELDTFVYGASEWEDRPEDHEVFATGIVAAAHDLVHDSRDGRKAVP